jgi:hypothetical protein
MLDALVLIVGVRHQHLHMYTFITEALFPKQLLPKLRRTYIMSRGIEVSADYHLN